MADLKDRRGNGRSIMCETLWGHTEGTTWGDSPVRVSMPSTAIQLIPSQVFGRPSIELPRLSLHFSLLSLFQKTIQCQIVFVWSLPLLPCKCGRKVEVQPRKGPWDHFSERRLGPGNRVLFGIVGSGSIIVGLFLSTRPVQSEEELVAL